MESIIASFVVLLLVLFLAFETINWFGLQSLRLKIKFQKNHCTQEQADIILKRVRLIYFWLSSDYYYNRLRELYFFVYESPEVSYETKDGLYHSLSRRFVKGLTKAYQ